MTPKYLSAQMAEGRVRLAMGRLAGRYPFHVRVLDQFQVRAERGLDTMAVTVRDGKLVLLHCPEFVLQTPVDVLAGVLLHEVLHVLFGHLTVDPTDFPDEWALTVAQEITVNEFVKEPLPEGVITRELFPKLPPLESTRESYKRLKKVRRRFPISPPASTRAGRDGGGGRGPYRGGQGGKPKAKAKEPRHTADDHRYWREGMEDLPAAREAVRDALVPALLEVGTDGLPDAVCNALQELGVGTAPGEQESELGADRPGRLNWPALLRRHVGQLLEPQPALHRPPRRFPELAGIVPARCRRPRKPRVTAVIDTSASMDDELLKRVDGELRRLARAYAVTVVECDTRVRKVYPYRPLKSVTGRGGTDFRPPLEPDFLRAHPVDLVVYFTDGRGLAPDRPPGIPVVWCLTSGGVPPARWGQSIHMEA